MSIHTLGLIVDVMQTTMTNETTRVAVEATHRPDPDAVMRAIAKRSFATLATVSPSGCPHVAGVLYGLVDDVLWINTMRSGRKARNIADNPRVAVTVPIRRLPIGPPATVHFQSAANIVALDAPEVARLVERGELASITGHDELEIDGGCFVRIPLPRRLLTFGLGMSLVEFIRHPLAAGGLVER